MASIESHSVEDAYDPEEYNTSEAFSPTLRCGPITFSVFDDAWILPCKRQRKGKAH